MKIEVNNAFKPMLEFMIDGSTIKTISEALNLHLLKTLKAPKPRLKTALKKE